MKKDLGIKILALFLAVSIWFMIKLTKQQRVSVRIPIAITNTPSALIPLSIMPENLELTIEGSGKNILLYKSKKESYYINLKDAHYGKNYYPIDPDLSGLEVLDEYNLRIIHKPSVKNILITMDNMSSKIVPVRVTFVDKESEQFFQENKLTVSPETIQIKGPKTLLAKVFEVPTIPFNTYGFDKNTEIRLTPLLDKRISMERATALIKERPPKIIQKTISLLSISTSKGIEIFPNSVSIKISGEEDILQKITTKDIVANIDTTASLEKDSLIAVEIFLPKGVKLIAQTPQYVRIKNLP
jgi:YbbR domain-containing protein